MGKHPRKKQKLSATVQPLGSVPYVDNEEEKDDEERRLESLLFGKPYTPGSASGKGKENHILVVSNEEEDEEGEGGGNAFEQLDNADLFFVDDAQPDAPTEVLDFDLEVDASSGSEASGSEDEDEVENNDDGEKFSEAGPSGSPHPDALTDAPSDSHLIKKSKKATTKKAAWADPDDAALRVSLATTARARKLRDAPGEDMVAGTAYEARLRREFERINPQPEWAAAARKQKSAKRRRASAGESGTEDAGMDVDGVEGVDDLLASTDGVLRSGPKGGRLEKGVISVERLRDANQSARAEGEIKALQFHPSLRVPVLMTASTDRRVRLFNIDGHTNPHLQTVHVPALPLTSAAFHPSGASVFLAGPRPFYYTLDLQSGACTRSPRGLWGTSFAHNSSNGKSAEGDLSTALSAFSPDGDVLAIAGRRGYVHLVDWRAGGAQVVGSVKMNGGVQALWWSRSSSGQDGGELMTLGSDAEIYAWDVGERRCVRRWKDDGGFGSTVMTGDVGGGYLGIGSRTGLVNVYGADASDSFSLAIPKPLKTLGNLTTSISTLRFNRDAQLLAMASNVKKDQMRLVHLPSLTTFSNWPTSGTPLGHVSGIDFSAGSEYVAIGNNRGRVLLYNIAHYTS